MNAKELETKYTYRQLRKMYQAAAQQARAAYKAVKAAYPGSAPEKLYKGDFKSFTTISKKGMKKADLAKQLASTQRYLSSRFSSVEAYEQYRESAIDTFKSHGYDFVNEDNFNEVQEFMKDMTERGLKGIYGSDQILTAFNRANERGLSEKQLAQNIEYWSKNAADVEAGRRSGKLRVYSKVPGSSKDFQK